MSNEFSVVQFFKDGTHEYVRRFASSDEAMKAIKHYTTSVAVKMGLVERVIITDGGDCCCFEWIHDKGITFPSLEKKKNEITN
jgi:hypothetical protein